jgi:hypothetical protein
MVERILSEQEIRDIFERSEQRREKVCRTMEKAVPKLKKEISEKNEILVTPEDLGKKVGLGSFLFPKHPTSVYWDAKYCLWKDGIFVGSIRKDHKSMTIIRARKPEDKLPEALKTKEEAIKELTEYYQKKKP